MHTPIFPAAVQQLCEQFAKLPGVGRKSAQRMAFALLNSPNGDAEAFAQAILDARTTVKCCVLCQNMTDEELCPLCRDTRRDTSTICVVAEARDVVAIERTREYQGLYHVLHGVISPLNHVGPEDLTVKALLQRVNQHDVKEIIMATNPDTEGEATALYLAKLLLPFGVKLTRLAYGIPMGSHLEFTDEITLSRALHGRTSMG
ncbi:MAG: recombination mediator RecR [Oscillospiraceae bacterium]|nr:recombination mediator RecR [Oscillospiraceae bacterium]